MAEKKSTGETSEGSKNFLKQFRDIKTRDFKRITASQFMDVWNHYDSDGNGFIEGKELDNFLYELVTSVNVQDVGPEVVSQTALDQAKNLILAAFDENKDGKIDIAELAQILPMEENFLLLFRRDHPLESSVEFMKLWRDYDTDCSGFIEADELKNFLYDLLKQSKKEGEVSEEQLITYADTMLQLFDRNKDGKLQISEMAKLLPVRENFLCRPIFKSANKLNRDDIERVFNLYDRDHNDYIEDEELHGFLKDLMELVQEDFDADDLDECKQILLGRCDLNNDGKISKKELTLMLTF
ncbi:calbindin-32-like isoform X2 [Gigantopelta aegis]|uniref:calbindin-32-like isoform X2 n=1 Tax=Gigantopelta aegis TaxID=1735272 RepID=UPI001B88C8DA|nr:calbindin-32-like isoform X2 [Gigantopelta aegis]